MKTYLVVPNHTHTEQIKQLTQKMLESVRSTSDVHIVMVDDASPLAHDFSKMVDTFLVNNENMGFAMTCNRAFKYIMEIAEDDDFVVCANTDIEVFNGWLQALQEPFSFWDNVAFAGMIGMQNMEEAKKFKQDEWSSGGLYRGYMQSGGLWMSRVGILKKIGIFDEIFERGGMEDVDLFLRARDTFGMKIIMTGRSAFWHLEGGTRWHGESGWVKANRAIESTNERRFFEKWGYWYRSRQVWKEHQLCP